MADLSVMQKALGQDFKRLHPRIQEQYGITSRSGAAFVGKGFMEKVWRGRWYVLPFLYLGAVRRILFPETGEDVPFEIRNYAYLDRFGRETVTWKRTFAFADRVREFDEFFIYSEERKRAILYAGTHQHLAVDLSFDVEEDGALIVRTEAQRLFVGPFVIPFPRFFSGDGIVRESVDDATGTFYVDVLITNPFWGDVLGYRGSFELEKIPCGEEETRRIRPVREVRRE